MGQALERRARLGKYEIMEELGVGAMSTVYKARNTEDGAPVAIKVPDRRLLSNVRARRQFKREGEALIRLRHPNIVRVHAVGQLNDLPYIVMDYVDGHTLSQEIHHRGKFSEEETIALLAPLANALDYSHGMNTFHCDVKPGNIRLRRDRIPVLVDFGIVQTTDGTVWDEGKPVGSVWYMSPEQARGERASARSDQYSLAVVAYEMLTGKVPFDGDNPYSIVLQQRDVQPPIPAAWSAPLKAVMQRTLVKAPQKRFSSCLEFIAALDEAGHGRMPAHPEVMQSVGRFHVEATVDTTRYADSRRQATPFPTGSARKASVSSRQKTATIIVPLGILFSATIIVFSAIGYGNRAGNVSTVTRKDLNQPSQSEPTPTIPAARVDTAPAIIPNPPSTTPGTMKSETGVAEVKAVLTEGDFYYENGEYTNAINTYRIGLQKDPGNLKLQQRLKRAQKALDTERSVLNQ